MSFSTLLFLLIILPNSLLADRLAQARLRNPVLLFLSLFFYWYSGGKGICFLAWICVWSWMTAQLIGRSETPGKRKGWTALSISVEIAVLAFFKYAGIIWPVLCAVTGTDEKVSPVSPPGISFITFAAIAYEVDVFRGSKAEKNPFDVALPLSFFPLVISGPIVRHGVLADQFRMRQRTLDDLAEGFLRFCKGLCLKVLIAGPLGEAAVYVFDNPLSSGFSAPVWWFGLFAYAMQLYFDFSSYSDMAIGISRMFGIRIPENFRDPYLAVTGSDFWRRWHISLSEWFRDYVYIPLGGSRKGDPATVRNLLAVWLLTGIWHGAGWTFVLWGTLWWLVLVLERFRIRPETRNGMLRRSYSWMIRLFAVLDFGIFRCADLPGVLLMFRRLFGPAAWTAGSESPMALSLILGNYGLYLVIALILALGLPGMWFGKIWEKITKRSPVFAEVLRLAFLGMLMILAVSSVVDSGYDPFLYAMF